MTEFTRRVILIVSAEDQDAANILGESFDPDIGGSETFLSPLSATGEPPATHFACGTSMTPATLAQVEATKAESFPTGKIYRGVHELDDEEGVERYTFDQALADAVLQRITQEDD